MDRYLNAYNNLSKPNYIPENQFKLTLASTTAPRIPRNVWSKKFFALASGEVSSYKFHSQGNSKRQGDDAWRGLWLKWFTGENVWASVFQKNITLLQTPPSQFWIIIPRCNTCQYLRSTKENSNYLNRVPREILWVALWMSCHVTVWVPSWTGWHILPRSHAFNCSRLRTGIYFVTLVHRWNIILGDSGAISRVGRAFIAPFLPTWLTAPGSPRMSHPFNSVNFRLERSDDRKYVRVRSPVSRVWS